MALQSLLQTSEQQMVCRSGRTRWNVTPKANQREGFTLTELLISIGIASLIASMLIVALGDAREKSRVARTRAQINYINSVLMTRWESFRTRPLPVQIDLNNAPSTMTDAEYIGRMRLNGLRDLMRIELPDRKTDLLDVDLTVTPYTSTVNIDPGGITQIPLPTVTRIFLRRVDGLDSADDLNGIDGAPVVADWAKWTVTHQGAECLYMILQSIRDEMGDGLEFFRESEIRDTDNDGMLEVVDSWGNPIEFIRWPAGHVSQLQDVDDDGDLDRDDAEIAPDIFDPLFIDVAGPDGVYGTPADDDSDGQTDEIDERLFAGSDDEKNYALFPLVISAGVDEDLDIVTDRTGTPISYSSTTPPNDPYVLLDPGTLMGQRIINGSTDDISNHSNLVE